MSKRLIVAGFLAGLVFPFFVEAQFLLETAEPTQTNVDLLMEAKTYTPVFYKGRPEPSANNLARIVAVPRQGTPINKQFLNYRWEVDGSYHDGGVGQDSITILMPYRSSVLVEVVITDLAGDVVGVGGDLFEASDYVVRFYEDNALRGLSRVSLGRNFNLVGEEALVRAEPYFIGENDGPPNLIPSWIVNGSERASESDWRQLTINSEDILGSQGSVVFSYYDLRNLAQESEFAFKIVSGL